MLHVTSIYEARAALSHAFDTVLVDYDLPDGKGTEVVRALRAAGARIVCTKKDFGQIVATLSEKPD